jgi:hypothetical protein
MLKYLKRLVFSVAIAAALAAAPHARAQIQPGAPDQSVQAKLASQVEYFQSQKYRISSSQIVDRIAAAQSKKFAVQLASGVVNAVVATCGQNCDHIEIAIYDDQRKLLARSPEKKDTVVILGNPELSGSHDVEMTVPGCHATQCEVGVVVLRQPVLTLQKQTESLVEEFHRLESAPLERALVRLPALFGESIDYYGHVLTRDQVMEDKRQYFARWPERQYDLVPGSLAIRCTETSRLCEASGTVRYMVKDPGTGRHIDGTASFKYGIIDGPSGLRVNAENGKVETRRVLPTKPN